MNRSTIRNLILSLGLVVLIAGLVVSTLVYQVSAVVLAGDRSLEKWKAEFEAETGYTRCIILDDSIRVIRILSLQCRKGSQRYVHVAEGGTLLGDSPVDAFDFESSQMWAKANYGDEATVSISYYQGQTVLRILYLDLEVLVDPITRRELWKVDLGYE